MQSTDREMSSHNFCSREWWEPHLHCIENEQKNIGETWAGSHNYSHRGKVGNHAKQMAIELTGLIMLVTCKMEDYGNQKISFNMGNM